MLGTDHVDVGLSGNPDEELGGRQRVQAVARQVDDGQRLETGRWHQLH